MPLKEEYERQGVWLFKWRSYLPLPILAFQIWLIPYSNAEHGFANAMLENQWEWIALGVTLLGELIRVLTLGHTPPGTSGRNTDEQIADSLNTSGIYSAVRNPLYVGNFLVGVGFSMFIHTWWFTLLVVIYFWWYYERIIFTEEGFLREKYGQAYTDWCDRTPAFFPNIFKWSKASLPFSLRTVIRKDRETFYIIVAWFAILHAAETYFTTGVVGLPEVWQTIMIVATAAYLVIRILDKTTNLLKVKGR